MQMCLLGSSVEVEKTKSMSFIKDRPRKLTVSQTAKKDLFSYLKSFWKQSECLETQPLDRLINGSVRTCAQQATLAASTSARSKMDTLMTLEGIAKSDYTPP
jgi:hypothetical protein